MTITRDEALTKKFVDETFLYADGVLYWKERPLHHFKAEWIRRVFNKKLAGTVAGSVSHGYRRVTFLHIGNIAVHRLIFLMHHGFLPENVDHIDGNTMNNKIENLRAATHRQNMINQKTSSRNTSGAKGVSLHKNNKTWSANICVNGKQKHLGSFLSLPEAIAARKLAEEREYGEFRNDR